MTIEFDFNKTVRNTFNTEFSQIYHVSDGGYERGHAEGFEAGVVEQIQEILGGKW